MPRLKYKEILQQLVDRAVNEISIDLDDLQSVRGTAETAPRPQLTPTTRSGRSKGATT